MWDISKGWEGVAPRKPTQSVFRFLFLFRLTVCPFLMTIFDTFCNYTSHKCHQRCSVNNLQNWVNRLVRVTDRRKRKEKNDGRYKMSESREEEYVCSLWIWHRGVSVITERTPREEATVKLAKSRHYVLFPHLLPAPSEPHGGRRSITTAPLEATNKRMWLGSHAGAFLALWPSTRLPVITADAVWHHTRRCNVTREKISSRRIPCWIISDKFGHTKKKSETPEFQQLNYRIKKYIH